MSSQIWQEKINLALKVFIWLCLGLFLLIPLLVYNRSYFPFIYTKAVAFKAVVELIFVAYLLLAARVEKYRLKFNILTIIFGIFVVSSFISSIFGVNFYRSFWSNTERSEGLILLIHLWLFLLVVTNFLKTKKEWLYIFEASLAVSGLISLYALAQYFQLNLKFIILDTDIRLSATIGNASYLAGYLIFNISFALYLLLARWQKLWAKVYYPLLIILEVFILLQTGTRGGVVALAVMVLILLIYLIFQGSAKIKKISFSFLLLTVILMGTLFVFKDNTLITKMPSLQRAINFDLNDRTIQTRFMTWSAAWQGFKEKPILGYGYENFNVVFNKYFDPRFYEDEGSRVWFDRAHNIIFDHLVTGGLIGLLLFLLFIFYPVYRLVRSRNDLDDEQSVSNFEFKSVKLILTLAIIAYFIQNLFVFDNLVTLVPLFFTLAFIVFLSSDCTVFNKFFNYEPTAWRIFIFAVILLIPSFYYVVVRPTQANQDAILALTFQEIGRLDQAVGYYQKALNYNTFGNQEFRIMLTGLVNDNITDKSNVEFWQAAIEFVGGELDKQITQQPQSVANYLLRMRFNNAIRVVDRTSLNQNFDLFEKAVELSPRRPHLYYEIGYTQLYVGAYYKQEGNLTIAQGFYNDALNSFKKVVELASWVVESHLQYVMALINVGQADATMSYLDEMEKQGIDYRVELHLSNLADTAIYFKEYQLVKRFFSDLTKLVPNNQRYWINLALADAYLGEDDEAITIANKIITEFPEIYHESARVFIEDIKAGKFKQDN